MACVEESEGRPSVNKMTGLMSLALLSFLYRQRYKVTQGSAFSKGPLPL